MKNAYRIRQGETIAVLVQSSIVMSVGGDFRVVYDNGRTDDFHISSFTTGLTRVVELAPSGKVANHDGWIVSGQLGIAGDSAGSPKRGQTYVRALVGNHPVAGGLAGATQILLSDYMYNGYSPTMGVFRDPGPGGGEGYKQWRLIVEDVTPIDVTEPLAEVNTFRRVFGVAWYYNCAAEVANRSTVISVRKPGIGRPTGFVTAFDIWKSSAFTMDTGQEGLVYAMKTVGGDGFSITNDNGVIAVDTTTTAPVPFPLEVIEADLAEMFFDVTNPHADDRHTIMIYQEEWMVI